ncbi:MAG TPA: hypothetical protein VF702_00675 [Allosphingosinicella sp.]
MAFSSAGAIALATYFLALLIGGTTWWFQIISAHYESIALRDAILISFTAAGGVSALFYVRKLYKDLFASVTQPPEQRPPFALLATFLYFLVRPFFAAAMAVLFIVIMYGFVHAVTTTEPELGFGFLVFSSTASAIIAVGTGRGVTRLERFAKEGEGPFSYHV